MPLTPFQAALAKLLSASRTPDSYLAGGAALHRVPNSARYSNDLDYFNDSVERVATAFRDDTQILADAGYTVTMDMNQPGYIRARVAKNDDATKVEWAHDSAWRFMPTVRDDEVGYILHPVDLAINKVLALAGRNEPRDFLDVVECHTNVLPLGAMVWAAAGKDPGFTPLGLIDLLRRRGQVRPEELGRLHLAKPVDLRELKQTWTAALDDAEAFVKRRPPDEVGCLYYDTRVQTFVRPPDTVEVGENVVTHHGRPGGILPRCTD